MTPLPMRHTPPILDAFIIIIIILFRWTPENDLLTAAMKLKRVPIVAKHKEVLDELYS